MKTPLEIARYTFGKLHSQAAEECENEILAHIESAIETDRAQRDIYELIAEALDDRADWDDGDGERAQRAAEILRNNESEDAWDLYLGPMLDDMMTYIGEA